MNDIITNGTEIKQRILSEIGNAKQNIFLAMAWFTDRDIAAAIIGAKTRGVFVDVILSSNSQNETVKSMFRAAEVSLHAFETGDSRGIMHHKFCLIDNRISINGSYNYSYNASNNNVENIQVSDDPSTYKQLFSEFERLKYNIDHNIDVNVSQKTTEIPTPTPIQIQPMNIVETFSQRLHDLVYSSVLVDTESYKKHGYEKSKESAGNLDVYMAEYGRIKEELRANATNDDLSGKKNVIISNIANAWEGVKVAIEKEKENEIATAKSNFDLEVAQKKELIVRAKQEKSIIEVGNPNTGEKGILEVNKLIEKNKLEKRLLEQSLIVRKFWNVGTVLAMLALVVFCFMLSLFFASAIYKIVFEENTIRRLMETGITPEKPPLFDANAIVRIFQDQGVFFGFFAMFFFLAPILLSNLSLLGNKNKTGNRIAFWFGVLIFDIVVAFFVAFRSAELKSLLEGTNSQISLWDIITQSDFWLIFVFGTIPLIITHFIIDKIENAYVNSQLELVDQEKSKKIKVVR
jgi:hypothetical protein